MFEELEKQQASEPAEHQAELVETLPEALCSRLRFPGRLQALKEVHFPEAGTPMTELMSATTPGHRRLIFEELFYLELGLELKRRRMREREGTAFVTNVKVREGDQAGTSVPSDCSAEASSG